MEYLSVRSAEESYIRGIELKIKNFVETDCYLPFNIRQILKSGKCSKDFYKILNDKDIIHKSQQKWEREFPATELKWKILYSIPAYCSSNTKLHWL